MKAVILAAGKSTRTWPLTITRPKPLLKVANKPLLEQNLDQLEGLVDEAIIIVGYKKAMIKAVFGAKYKGIKLRYVEQRQQLGTGHALLRAERYVKGSFLMMMGDDLYFKDDIEKCIKHQHCVLAYKADDPRQYGLIKLKEKDCVKEVSEKPKIKKPGIVFTGLFVSDKKVFSLLKELKKSPRGEYEVSDALDELAKQEKVKVRIAKNWLPVSFVWNLLDANQFIVSNVKRDIKGVVEKGATIKGDVIVGKGTVIKSGSYIEGPAVIGKNCKIGPNCYIRSYTSIGNNCKVGNAVEVKNSVFMDGVSAGHLSYIGDSVIGFNVNFGAGTITANLKHDNGNVKSVVKDEFIDTGRRKLGTMIGDNVHTGIHTSIYPGRKIWPGKSTLPGEVVKEDITE